MNSRRNKAFFKSGYPRERKRIRPDERVPLDLNDRERELILQRMFTLAF